ncbi:hypothetical protein [Aurantivibrio plasticivorans]
MSALVSENSSINAQATYRVVFWGETARGYDRDLVVRNFASRFKINSRRQLERLFSGKVITLKHSLPLAEAHRYIKAIQDVGAVCRMESEMKNYFGNDEVMTRHTVSFLENDVDMSTLSLAPKNED